MSPVKILIVDDSVLARRLISSALEVESFVRIVGSAVNGRNALQKIEQLRPDIVIMDLEMPEMDGIEALKKVKESHPHVAVIMYSSVGQNMSEKTILALELGAEDFIAKPSGSQDVAEAKGLIHSSLIPKIKALHGKKKTHDKPADPEPVAVPKPEPKPEPVKPTPVAVSVRNPPKKTVKKKPVFALKPVKEVAPPVTRVRTKRYPVEVVAIGVSTGGPNALSRLMPTIPASIPVPIVIVQHMPATFTKTLASRLDATSQLRIQEGQAGEVLKPGDAWIAPGGYHMVVERQSEGVVLQLNEDPPEQGCRPAVDVMFRSIAQVYGKNTLAVILTGMGKDGLDGGEAIIKEGGVLYAQDEESSVVWGMPGAVTRAGLAEKVVPLDKMGYEIMLRIESTLLHSNK